MSVTAEKLTAGPLGDTAARLFVLKMADDSYAVQSAVGSRDGVRVLRITPTVWGCGCQFVIPVGGSNNCSHILAARRLEGRAQP